MDELTIEDLHVGDILVASCEKYNMIFSDDTEVFDRDMLLITEISDEYFHFYLNGKITFSRKVFLRQRVKNKKLVRL